MSRIGLFVAGIVVGVAMQIGIAQKRTEMYENHVGIAAPNVADALAFYTPKMGFREAFRQTAQDGELVSAYVQVSKNADLNGVRIELAELTPDSLQRKAIDSWK
jgi:hypothetical protein